MRLTVLLTTAALLLLSACAPGEGGGPKGILANPIELAFPGTCPYGYVVTGFPSPSRMTCQEILIPGGEE